MEPTEKELEVRLRELGVRLASPPTDIDELLRLLDQTEIYLSRVKQTPSSSMSNALGPVMNSLITKEFLNHTKADVKVFVAACIHEIIRVTAPDAPYNDVLMKEIFAMIVDAFDKLDDMSGCSYSKRVFILEIMAKVHSCVVMLDLECDDLILHMFKCFLKSIRPDHPTNVFSSMEAIMTLILEESEDISLELLVCLLSTVQKSTKDVIPVACRLAEKVISNCLMKLKPYFLVAVQSMGTCLGDFGDIIASICKDSSITLEHNKADDNKLSERTVSDELAQESEKLDEPVSCLVEVGTLADTTVKVLSNGIMPLGNGHAVIEPISPELKPESSISIAQCRNVVPIGETNSLSTITEKPANEINFQYIEAKSSSVQLTDTIDNSRVVGDKETSTPTSQRDGLNGQAKSLKSDCVPAIVPETKVHLESEWEAELQLLAGLVDANPGFDSAAPAYSSPGSGLPSHFSEMKSNSHKPASLACKEKVSEITTMEKEGPTVVVSEHEDQNLASISDGKPLQDSKVSLAENVVTEVAAVGISDGQYLRKQQKEAASVVAHANTFENQRVSNIKNPKAEDVTDRDASAEPCLKAPTEANNDQNNWVKFARGSPTRKRQRKTSRLYSMHLDNIGRKIEVWWPDDERFYTGVIDAFDPVTKKHRVVYDDGDAEILFLRNERWNYIDSMDFEKGQENDIACPESSSQMPKKRKASSRKRNAARERKSVESGDQNSTFKPRGSPRHTTSELDPSLHDKISASRLYSMHLHDIGRKIEVWWPDDERFYTGVIDAFDPVTKKHRVVYDDGDAEDLCLRNERWNYIDSKNFEKGRENDIACPESSSQMPKKRKASSRKRKAAGERKSEESGDQNSTFKSSCIPRHTTSELDPSLHDKTSESLFNEETKFDTDKNYSTKLKSNRRFKRKNIATSGGPESVMRSRGGPEGDSFGRKSKIFEKDEGSESDSHKIKSPSDENFRSRRKSALKFSANFSRILNEEALKSPNSGVKGTITESSETNNVLMADTDEELKKKETLKSINMVSDSEVRRKKRKRTVIMTDTNDSDIKNLVDFSLKSGVRTNKRRRK